MSLSGEKAELRGSGGAAAASTCCSRTWRIGKEVAEVEDVASGLEPSVGAALLDGLNDAGACECCDGAVRRVLRDAEVRGDGSYGCQLRYDGRQLARRGTRGRTMRRVRECGAAWRTASLR